MSSTHSYDGDLGSLRLSPPLARSTPSSSPHPDEPSKHRSTQHDGTGAVDGSRLKVSGDRPVRPGHSKQPTLTRKISFPSDQLDPVQWERLRRWIVCFAVVEFDIDSGPVRTAEENARKDCADVARPRRTSTTSFLRLVSLPLSSRTSHSPHFLKAPTSLLPQHCPTAAIPTIGGYPILRKTSCGG